MISIDALSRHRTARPIFRIFFSSLAVMLLSGCAVLINPSTIASTVVDVISYTATGKGPTDHVISGLTNQDCALHRGIIDKPVCNPPKEENILKADEAATKVGQLISTPATSAPAKAEIRTSVR